MRKAEAFVAYGTPRQRNMAYALWTIHEAAEERGAQEVSATALLACATLVDAVIASLPRDLRRRVKDPKFVKDAK